MLLLHDRQDRDADESKDPDALIREARRLRRRRWITGVSVIAIVVPAAAVAFWALRSPAPRGLTPHGHVQYPASRTAGVAVTPKTPSAMTVGADGDLYVVDTGRDQILRRLADGRFEVVAGSDKQGFSGDGGSALHAELRLEYDAGIAVTSNGTVFFADSGNERVREVLPDGTIRTIAGGGSIPLSTTPVQALHAALAPGDPSGVAGLAIGPGGNLYLALPVGVYEVTGDGTLRHIIGARWNPKHVLAWNANPAGQGGFIDAARVAFDRAGDLFVAGGGGWGLYERTVKGALRFVEVFRGDGAGFFGSMATDREGNVLAVDNYGIQVLSASGHASTLTADPKELQDALNRALRHVAEPTPPGTDHNYFRGGYGIAAARNGTIYVDQDSNIWSRTSGILAVSPTGHVTTIWLSH